MGSFTDYLNKKNNTGNNNSYNTSNSNNSSFMEYHNKRQKQREEEEERRRKEEEERKRQEEQARQETEKQRKENANTSTSNGKSEEELLKEIQKNISTAPTAETKEKYVLPTAKTTSQPLMSTESLGDTYDIKYLKDELEPDKWLKSSEAFKDGYQFGDVAKTGASTIGNIGTNLWQGANNLSTGIAKSIAGGVAQVADWVGADEYADRVRNKMTKESPLDRLVRESNEKTNKNSVIGQKTENVIQGVGNIGGTLALQSIGVPWQATSGLSSIGSNLSEAYSEGASDTEAWLSAGISAGAEIGSEYLFGGIKLPGTGKTGDMLADGLTDKIKNKTIRQLTKLGINAVGEGSEEVISGIGNALGKKLTYMSDKELKELYSSEDALNDFVTGTITSAIVGGGQELTNTIQQNKTPIANNNVAETATNEGSYTKQQELLNNIENNQETLYNNNESESDINGEQQAIESNDERGTIGLFAQHEGRTTDERGYQIINEEQIARTKQEEIEYIRQPENQVNNLNNNQSRIKEAFESKGAKVVFYSLKSNKGGYYDNGTLYINENGVNDFGQLDEAIHEYAHYLIRDNVDFNSKITSIAEEIVRSEENGNSEAIRNYIMNRDENINIEDVDRIYQTVVEEILADYAIDVKKDIDFSVNNQYGIDSNILNKYKNMLKDYLPDIELQNSNKSSFSMQQNINSSIKNNVLPTVKNSVAPSMENNILPVAENKVSKEISLPKNFAKVNQELNNKENNAKVAELLGQLTNDKMTLKENKDFLVQKLVNKGHYIDQLAKITNNKELTYKYDRMLGAASEGQYEVGVAQTDNNGNKIGKSINDIWRPAEKNNLVAEFSDYLLHKHNIDRMKQGKPVFGEEITAEVSKKMAENYEKLYPDFIEWSKDIYQFNKNQLKNTTEAGLTSEELEMLLDDMYSSYVTISRTKDNNTMDKKNKVIAPNKTVKKAVGGNADIQPLKDAMAKQAIAVKQAIRRNDVGLELLKVLKTSEDTDSYDINNVLNQDKTGSYLLVFKDGKAKKLKITNGIFESLKPSQKYDLENNIFLKNLIQKPSKIQRSLLTVDNPIFMITNFFKDFQDGMFNSKYTSKFIRNYGKALSEIKNKGKYYEEYMSNGGSSNTYFDYEKGVIKDTKINKFLNKIRTGNEVIEMAPRLSEYISTREAGGSINEALYNAAEITTNFKRGGDIAKAINRNGANFLNASIQGLSKQIRNFSGQNGVKGYVNLLTKATVLSVLPSVLNHLLLGDDDDYEDLPDYVKDTYYLFKIGNNKFLRIPKGRVLSIFGSAARRSLEYSEGNKDAFNGFIDTVKNQMAPNNPFSDNIFAPITQSLKNETWYGGDLVPTRLQDELPENQYDESTDNFSKWLGKLTGISPIKINYVIDQYSGGVGDILLPMMTPQAENNVLTDKFTIDSVLNNKNVSKFYETLDKQTKISNAPEATDENLLKTKYLNNIQASISDLYKEKREVQLSSLSDKDKKEQVKKIQKEINDILEEGLKQYDKGKIYSNYATIGDEEYYKVTNIKKGTKEWNKLSEEEKEKNKNISLKTYANYKENIVQKTISQRKTGIIKENDSIKDKDKIQILLDNNYSNKEKTALYENYILSATDKKYPIIKETFTENGLNINKYLEYKIQEFSSDKKDDGTVDGKSISGSKKKKVWNYIENMNITYTQKLILYGLEYTPTNREQTQIVNYINSLPKTSQEKLEILDQFQGFTIYKNGTFKY